MYMLGKLLGRLLDPFHDASAEALKFVDLLQSKNLSAEAALQHPWLAQA
jgi:hypothetical protein